jgi:hypothetical protein
MDFAAHASPPIFGRGGPAHAALRNGGEAGV